MGKISTNRENFFFERKGINHEIRVIIPPRRRVRNVKYILLIKVPTPIKI